MSGLKRNILNSKIGIVLETFEKLNIVIKKYDIKFFEYFEELRDNLISVLNEIVDNYIYKTPEANKVNELKLNYENVLSENDFLKKKIADLQRSTKTSSSIDLKKKTYKSKSKNKFTKSLKLEAPLYGIEEKLSKIERDEKEKKKLLAFNSFLQWKSLKELSTPVNNLVYKAISKKQLLDFITELNEAKSVYDEGCRKQKQSLETLEQFMFNHLKKKYGLNSIVIEWVFGIIEAIKIHHSVNNDVAVFGMVG